MATENGHQDFGAVGKRPLPLSNDMVAGDCSPTCGCGSTSIFNELHRREFLKVAGLGVFGTIGGFSHQAMAGPFDEADVKADHLVPTDKKLDPAWIKALFERGEKAAYSAPQALANIGMPIGGIGAGQLYLCGDGTLGCWQIFNNAVSNWVANTGSTYQHRGIAKPIAQGFAVVLRQYSGQPIVRPLARDGFDQITFTGEYPIATVDYAADDLPAKVTLEAFSPFIPGNLNDSGLPATVFNITVENTTRQTITASLLGWLENGVGAITGPRYPGKKVTTITREDSYGWIKHSAVEDTSDQASANAQPPIVFEDLEAGNYDQWNVTGKAFGKTPSRGATPNQQPVSDFKGQRLVNSFDGEDGDNVTGKLTSKIFRISRPFINMLVGGGHHKGATCVNLIVDGVVRRTAIGRATEKLEWISWHVAEFSGKKARLEIIDDHTGGWGHILVDQIEFSDRPRNSAVSPLEYCKDYGAMALVCTQAGEPHSDVQLDTLSTPLVAQGQSECPIGGKLSGLLHSAELKLAPGEKQTVTFVLAWHFPNADHGQAYARRFDDASAVARYVLDESERLIGDTRLWRDTYYDSSLPYWLLDRLMSTVSTLATGTCQWWGNNRFWAYEGVSCCEGTCTHVWNYAHAHARLFPELGRNIRENQDFNPRALGGGFHPENGLVGFRSNDAYAADGQCGTILKAYREHLMSADRSFLHRFWERIKKALQYAIEQDGNNDGLIENSQHNTFDINYEGPNTFVGSLYLAALRAGEMMAHEMGEQAFAKQCRAIFESGRQLTAKRLWDGEYFVQEVDLKQHPQHQYAHGCLSDHLFGQGWAHQLGLGYLYPPEMVRSALKAIWKYNWAPDVKPYNDAHKPLRWFITPGQAGLFTCTWPKSDFLPEGTLYKSEVWTGIEYQVAGHMIAEGMLTEGLAICRAVHDRYAPELFNPYNEIECGDHYARAMASWGVYLALLGFDYHGPNGALTFAPQLTPENFRAAFTVAEGWGTFAQERQRGVQTAALKIAWGRLRLKTLTLELADGMKVKSVIAQHDGRDVKLTTSVNQQRVTLTFEQNLIITAGEMLSINCTLS